LINQAVFDQTAVTFLRGANLQQESEHNKQSEWHAQLLAQGLDQLGQAMIIVSCRAEVVYVSKSANAILDEKRGIDVTDGHISAELSADDKRLQDAVARVIQEDDTQANQNVYIHRDDFTRPLMLSVNKMPKSEQERREGHHALILIKDLNLNQEFWLDRLREEYHLAPRETQCVALLAEGNDLSDVAEIMDIGKETVRHYMKSVYKKMKVHKQHELVSLALDYRRNR